MTFLYPYVLCGLLLPLLLALAALLRRRYSRQAWRQLVSAAHESRLVQRRAPWHRGLGGALILAALAAAIVALARPINGYHEAGALTTGRNLLIALDISRSMETQDVTPSRLEEARAAAYELIDALPEDKIGLIVFSGTADLVVPLTYDHTALREALEQVDRSWASDGGTNFSYVLRKAMQDFARSAPEGTNAVLLLSDGEETVGSAHELAQEARDKHLLVITVGIGTEAGGPIPDPEGDNGLWQDANGKHVISKLDTASLQAFAQDTGGDYFVMGPHTDLAAFARSTVRKLDTHEEEFSVNKVPNDLFGWFAGPALALLLLGILCLTDWRLPKRGAAALLLMLLLAAPAAASPSSAGSAAYALGEAQVSQDADKAKELFSTALLDEDEDLQAAALYAIGNANCRASFDKLRALYESPDEEGSQGPGIEALEQMVKELRTDIASYDSALHIRPGMKAASTNKARTEELIQKIEEEIERLKQQQNQQDKQQQNQDQQDKDKQQQNQDQQDKDKPQQNQDQQDKDKQQQNQDRQDKDKQQQNQDQQDKDKQQQNQDRQDKDKQQQNQDRQDKDKQQQNQDRQDKDKQQQNQDQQDKDKQQQNQDRQDKDKQQQNQDRQDKDKQQQARPEKQPVRARELSDKEKAEQRAAAILQMHLDEEKGSPIPHVDEQPRTPEKDY